MERSQALATEPITAIIPAYNEERTLGRVLSVVTQVEQIHQIIVVDDGSTDDTAAVAQTWQVQDSRVILHQMRCNGGKGGAMFAGARMAQNDLLLFLDADLLGLRPQHIQQLIQPVQDYTCAMTVARFKRGRWPTDLAHLFLPYLSGQRCLRWSLFRDLFQGETSGWSIEVALNLHAWQNGYPICRVPWLGVSHAMRPEKRRGLIGYGSHARMWWDIGRYVVGYGLRPRMPHRLEELKVQPETELFYHL